MSSQSGGPKSRRREPAVEDDGPSVRNGNPKRRAVLDKTVRLLKERPPLTTEEIEAIKKSGTFPLPKVAITGTPATRLNDDPSWNGA